MNLEQLLPQVLPDAVAWVEQQSLLIGQQGLPLNEAGIELAKTVGVLKPDEIRIMQVNEFPLPSSGLLRDVAIHTGLLGPEMHGITFGHSILIKNGHMAKRLLSHEFRHVHQYESFGSIGSFLAEYFNQIASVGYENSPLEIDARNHEQ